MKIKGKQIVEVEITERELAYALMDIVRKKLKLDNSFDDAGCDWVTDKDKTYIGNNKWLISNNPEIASMINTVNLLIYNQTLGI